MTQTIDPDYIPFRYWCQSNGIGISTAYKMVNEGKLHITKIGKRSYLSREDRETFRKSLQDAAWKNPGRVCALPRPISSSPLQGKDNMKVTARPQNSNQLGPLFNWAATQRLRRQFPKHVICIARSGQVSDLHALAFCLANDIGKGGDQ